MHLCKEPGSCWPYQEPRPQRAQGQHDPVVCYRWRCRSSTWLWPLLESSLRYFHPVNHFICEFQPTMKRLEKLDTLTHKGPRGKHFRRCVIKYYFPRVSWELSQEWSWEAPSKDHTRTDLNYKNSHGPPMIDIDVKDFKIHYIHRSDCSDEKLNRILTEICKHNLILKQSNCLNVTWNESNSWGIEENHTWGDRQFPLNYLCLSKIWSFIIETHFGTTKPLRVKALRALTSKNLI